MTNASTPILGIDLGTTYSLVAVLQNGAPTILPNALGARLTPSAVSIDDDGAVLIGAAALARAITHPEATALAFKRDMGTERAYSLAGRTLTPRDLSALVLRSLREDAEAALGHPFSEAVVTVPAYFGDAQRQTTRDAGAIAGLKVDRIINEPTAAALAYGLHRRERECKLAVLDLGGGTFDVTILEIIEGCIEVLASAGDARLGGEDFVDSLLAPILLELQREAGSEQPRRAIARARAACEAAKCRLSAESEVQIVVPGLELAGGRRFDLVRTIEREQAERLWRPLLERISDPIFRALRDARLRFEQLDEVLLVGGATRMPCVVELATRLFGRLPQRDLPPDEAVAMGAAVQAGLKANDASVEELIATDVAPFTLGIASSNRLGSRLVTGIFSPILERGTVIPASRVERFTTVDENQTQIVVAVYQGEHASCDRNQLLGKYTVCGIPRSPPGEEAIDIRFSYDLNGILEVETTIVSTGHRATTVIEERPGKLRPEQVKDALAALQRLKFHPRDSLPNRTALARAEARFVDLTGEERRVLGEMIASFRLALEGQEPSSIAEARERLNALTEALRQA